MLAYVLLPFSCWNLNELVSSWRLIKLNLGMASPSTSVPNYRENTQKSHLQLTVCLVDWWLVKAENAVQGRRLGVAGHTGRGKQAMRVFTSAPILKRYDDFNLETADGICVILSGLINKARTLENGFPSAVFIYFNFGFPPYWKDCDERFLATDGTQPRVDCRGEDFGSQGKSEAKDTRKSNQTKSLAIALPQRGSVSGLQKESYSVGTSVEDHTTPELPVNCPENKVKSLSDLGCDQNISDGGGTLSAHHLYNKRTKRGAHDLTRMGDKITKTNSDWDMSSSEKILSRNEVTVMTRSMTKFKTTYMNNQSSAGIAEFEKHRLNSVSSIGSGEVELKLVDREPGSRNNLNSEISGLHRCTEKIEFSLSDASSTKEGLDQIPETCSQDKGISGAKSRRKIRKDKNKATELPCAPATPTKSHHDPAAVDTPKETAISEKSSLSKKAEALDSMTRQISVPVSKKTLKRKQEKGWSASPQSGSFTRSRSGRLLMPTLEFWRNQRAVYDADRTITGIEEGMHS